MWHNAGGIARPSTAGFILSYANQQDVKSGGERGIRTPDGVAPIPIFGDRRIQPLCHLSARFRNAFPPRAQRRSPHQIVADSARRHSQAASHAPGQKAMRGRRLRRSAAHKSPSSRPHVVIVQTNPSHDSICHGNRRAFQLPGHFSASLRNGSRARVRPVKHPRRSHTRRRPTPPQTQRTRWRWNTHGGAKKECGHRRRGKDRAARGSGGQKQRQHARRGQHRLAPEA